MSRTLPAGLAARITDPVTSRRWLLHLAYDPAFRVYSGQGVVSWGGFAWNSFPFEIRNIRFGAAGDAKATIMFSNVDTALTGLFLGPQGVSGIAATLYHFDSGEAVSFIDGYLSSAKIGQSAEVVITTENASRQSAPRLVSGPPLANWITPAGTAISWGNQKLIVDRRE